MPVHNEYFECTTMKAKDTSQIALSKLCTLLMCLFLSGCEFFDSDRQDNNVDGRAVKGVISNGIISAYRAEDNSLITQTRSDSSGYFSLDLNELEDGTLVLLSLSVDTDTRMLCDLVEGCIEKISGQTLSFGEAVRLPAYFQLLGLTSKQTHSTTFLSPLSHLIVKTAQSLPQGLNAQNIVTATQWVMESFDLESDPLTTPTLDLTKLSDASDESLKQAILSASLYEHALDTEWIGTNQLLDHIPLANVFYTASDLAEQLSAYLDTYSDNGNSYASALSSITNDAQNIAEDLDSAELQIQTQPQSIHTSESQSFSLFVLASGAGSLSYQWQKDGENIPGATASSYNKTSAQLSDSGLYSVTISNSEETIHSLEALVSVEENVLPVSISQQPSASIVTEGETISLSVLATGGDPISYQWQKNGSLIPGATHSTLTISPSSISDTGSYRVSISNNVSQVYSNFVSVTVNEQLAAPSINSHPVSLTVSEGSSASFSVNAGGGGFLTYQWRHNGTDISGAYSNTLSLNSVELSDAGSYDVTVSNTQGSATSFSANLSVLSISVPVSITQQPYSQEINAGESVDLTVRTSGDGPFSYQWLFNGEELVGANSQDLSISNAGIEDTGLYSVVVSNASSEAYSQEALVSVNSLPSSLELSWSAPSTREDGSALESSEISAYVIEYAYNNTELNQSIRINSTGSETYNYIISDVQSGTMYLRIATVDSNEIQSQFSETISIDIP
ncbi:hypothetical protein A3740_09090 [Oleiphilus sp. HI0068]|jgi:hypothetical protein|nr:immunoglobulin domain-containing protein [Oleiphilus sp. HI0128]KZY36978.1 hypothetical protein A3729_03625 [Oleiphilus sp. HI0043]KZY56467.1 hypothetical protein A3735_04590 [Oleiphilus sp. HI0061]KZY75155.1 hypothetical protein A3741_12630 [Oleiphilus sp. HI0069]KZY77985.1 hypothetical protein A3740_09090 [Oleiphilus sp. HI0068]KZZ36061.1 hypothetical protein A3756_02040 [Oleiphilus sp. HI0086]KZZ37247.1 hypothetical protein A3757_01820 [Oleiphilus sp. HI0117]KZZ57153.1 hypothetical pro